MEENKNFDIALLDVMLPGIDGFEVCKRLRAQSSSIGITVRKYVGFLLSEKITVLKNLKSKKIKL